MEGLRRRRQQRRPDGPVQPGRRDLRRRALPEGRRRRQGHPRRVFAYNHADWYVDSVLLRAQVIGGLPSNLVGSLTGLTEGRFPVAAKASYADEVSKPRPEGRRAATARSRSSGANRRGITIYADAGSPVVAVSDVQVTKIGVSERLGDYVQVQDAYGNTYTYGQAGQDLPALRRAEAAEGGPGRGQAHAGRGAQPDTKPNDGRVRHRPARLARDDQEGRRARRPSEADARDRGAARSPSRRSRSACSRNPTRVERRRRRRRPAGVPAHGPDRRRAHAGPRARPRRATRSSSRSSRSARRCPPAPCSAASAPRPRPSKPYVRFEIRPAGRGAPRIDPKPILDGWKLLESTAIYRAKGKNPFVGPDAATPTDRPDPADEQGDADAARARRPARSRSTTAAARTSRPGTIDRRVLATLEFLVASGFNPTVTSLHCGHSYLTASGNVSEHSTGTAVDIAAINGIPILGNQGKGSITDLVIQRLLTLQGTMKPHQIISLMKFEDADNTLVDGRPRRPHPRRLPRRSTARTRSCPSSSTPSSSPSSGPPDRAPGQDRQPDRAASTPSKAALKAKPSRKGPLTDDPRASASCSGSSRAGSARRPAATSSAATRATTCARSSWSPRAPRRAGVARREPPRHRAGDARDRDRRRPDCDDATPPTGCARAPSASPRAASSPPTASPPPTPGAPDPEPRALVRPRRVRHAATEVAEGEWTDARELPARPSRRQRRAAPSTARPSGSPRCCRPATSILACEELTLARPRRPRLAAATVKLHFSSRLRSRRPSRSSPAGSRTATWPSASSELAAHRRRGRSRRPPPPARAG